MAFAEDELHCDILSLVIVYSTDLCWAIRVGKHFSSLFFSSIVGIVLGPSIFSVSRFHSKIPYMFLARIFEPMKEVIHFGL